MNCGAGNAGYVGHAAFLRSSPASVICPSICLSSDSISGSHAAARGSARNSTSVVWAWFHRFVRRITDANSSRASTSRGHLAINFATSVSASRQWPFKYSCCASRSNVSCSESTVGGRPCSSCQSRRSQLVPRAKNPSTESHDATATMADIRAVCNSRPINVAISPILRAAAKATASSRPSHRPNTQARMKPGQRLAIHSERRMRNDPGVRADQRPAEVQAQKARNSTPQFVATQGKFKQDLKLGKSEPVKTIIRPKVE